MKSFAKRNHVISEKVAGYRTTNPVFESNGAWPFVLLSLRLTSGKSWNFFSIGKTWFAIGQKFTWDFLEQAFDSWKWLEPIFLLLSLSLTFFLSHPLLNIPQSISSSIFFRSYLFVFKTLFGSLFLFCFFLSLFLSFFLICVSPRLCLSLFISISHSFFLTQSFSLILCHAFFLILSLSLSFFLQRKLKKTWIVKRAIKSHDWKHRVIKNEKKWSAMKT